MRIAFLHYRFSPNPDYVDLVSKLRERGNTVWLGTPNQDGQLSWSDGDGEVAVQEGLAPVPKKLRRLPLVPAIWQRLAYAAFLRRLRAFMRRYRVEVVQALPPPNLPQLFPLMMPRSTRTVLAVKQMNLGVRRTTIGRLRDWFLVTSRATSAKYFFDHAVFDYHLTAEALLGPDWSRWATAIPLGLNPCLFDVRHPPLNDTEDKPVRFLYVGKISRFRQLERIILAAKKVISQSDQFVIDIIGPDKTEGYYNELVSELELQDIVQVKPPVPYETIPDLMTQYDVGLAYTPDYLTWHYQPTIKILEYRAVGLPILSTDVKAHRDLVVEGKNGVLVEDTVDGVADGLLCFINDRRFLRHCQENARSMRDGRTAAEVAMLHEEMYRKIM